MSQFLLPLLLLLGAAYLLVRWAGRGKAPVPGQPAPAFELLDGAGRPHRLSDHAGRWLVLYFYPRDDTPGCTAEACALRDAYSGFRERDVAVLGVSLDSGASHAAFTTKHRLPFPLLADTGGRVARTYGALWDFGLFRLAKRHTYLVDPAGRLARVYRSVTPSSHANQLLADIDRLRQPIAP